MKENEIKCKDVVNHICESLGEDLNSAQCIAIKKHLGECKNCASYFKTVEMTIDFYKKYNVELPEDAHDKLLKSLGLNT
ncbi:MAG: hypothetical protein Q8903_07850 [Bacteroidota bacterium]|nr:hypothetical protein [Bacteroidota bacterium]